MKAYLVVALFLVAFAVETSAAAIGHAEVRSARRARVRAETAISVAARKRKGARNASPVPLTGPPDVLERDASLCDSCPPTPSASLPSETSQLESLNITAPPMNHAQPNDNNNDLDWVEVKR